MKWARMEREGERGRGGRERHTQRERSGALEDINISVWVASEFESVPSKLFSNHPRCSIVSGLTYKGVWHQTIIHAQLRYLFDNIIYQDSR